MMDNTTPENTTSAPRLDMALLYARIEQDRRERASRTRETRAAVLVFLRDAGIEQVEATYDAYGDSGNIETVTLLPALLVQAASEAAGAVPCATAATSQGEAGLDAPKEVWITAEQERQISDLLWDVVYDLHPGFENNDGAYGEISWDIRADSITIEHAERFTDTNHFTHEGV